VFKIFVEKIKTHFMFSNVLENRVVYKIMWKYIVEQESPKKAI